MGGFLGPQAPPTVRRPPDDCQGLRAVFRAAQLLKARHGYRGQERQGRLCEGAGDQGGTGRQRHSFCTLETELGAPVTTEGCRLQRSQSSASSGPIDMSGIVEDVNDGNYKE